MSSPGFQSKPWAVISERLRRKNLLGKQEPNNLLRRLRRLYTYSEEPDWSETCRSAMHHALNLRHRFFDNLYEAIRLRRVQGLLDRIQSREPLAPESPDPARFLFGSSQLGRPLYTSRCICPAGIRTIRGSRTSAANGTVSTAKSIFF